jgi:hypothetical protein
MKGAFYGTYDLRPLPPKHWWSATMWEFTNDAERPLTFARTPFSAQPDRHFRTDFGSIPSVCQIIPALQKDRYFYSYLFHDSAYRHHAWYVSIDGSPFARCGITRAQADLWLHEMLLIQGASSLTAATIYRAVRLFGRFAW